MNLPPKITIMSLPSEVWAIISAMVDQVDEQTATENEEDYDTDCSSSQSVVDLSLRAEEFEVINAMQRENYMEMITTQEEVEEIIEERPLISAMACLSAVSTEFSILAFPFLWTHIDFEGRTNLECQYFLEIILPRHSRHVKSVWFRTSVSENNTYDDFQDEAIAIAAGATGKWNEKERRRIFAEIVKKLPNLISVDFDLLKPADSTIKSTIVAKALFNNSHKITELAICSPDTYLLDADYLSLYLADKFPNLKALNLEDVDAGGITDSSIVHTLSHFQCLEALVLTNTSFLEENRLKDVSFQFESTLKVLQLDTCPDLSLPTFITFVQKFKNLKVLDITESPSSESEADNKKYLPEGTRFDLPNLSTLVLSNFFLISFLSAFSLCPIECIELGFNPYITYDELFAFLGTLSKLKSVKISEESSLTDGNRESLEVWCLSRGIDCEVEEPMSDGSDDDDEEPFSADEDGSTDGEAADWEGDVVMENDSDSE